MKNTYKVGSSDLRPWGKWRVTDVGAGFCVKQIEVNPGGILSLQRHKHRNEHWIVVSGAGVVTLDNQQIPLGENKRMYIRKGHWHRIENRGSVPLIFIEIQTGDILDENDIERKEDKYGR